MLLLVQAGFECEVLAWMQVPEPNICNEQRDSTSPAPDTQLGDVQETEERSNECEAMDVQD